MTLLMFVGAMAGSYFCFSLLEGVVQRRQRTGRLQGAALQGESASTESSWALFLAMLFPGYFQPGRSSAQRDPVDLLRRAGYPFPHTGAFFSHSIRTFTVFLLAGGLMGGLVVAAGSEVYIGLLIAGLFILVGLRRPYTRLNTMIRSRAAAVRNNMLTGLALLNALLAAGVSVQESLRRCAGIGGPFCNLLALLVARMEVEPFLKAVEVVEAHVPDPDDVEVRLFFRAVRAFYNRNQPLLPAVNGLQEAVRRDVLESTEARAALVRQRSGLFGVFAVLGLVISIIAPFIGAVG